MHVICLTWLVCVFLLTTFAGGYLTLWCRNLCYDEFSLGVFCVGIDGVWVCGMVDLLGSVGERVDRDSPAKFVNLTLCQWDREQTWAILCCGLPLERPSGLRFLLYKTMGYGLTLFKFQGLGSIYVGQVAI